MLIIYLSAAWLVGIWLASAVPIPATSWQIAAALSVIISAIFHHKQIDRSSLWMICLFMLCAGGARYTAANRPLPIDHISHHNDSPRAVMITGIVIAEPDVRDTRIKLRVAVETITTRSSMYSAGKTKQVTGLILVDAFRYPAVPYGAQIELTGHLKTPFETAEFNYGDYLAQEAIYSTMSRPRLTILAQNQANPILSKLFAFKQTAIQIINQTIPSPESALLQAVLFGDKSGMPNALQEDFRTAGISHLTAISGFHVTIIMLAVIGLLDQFSGDLINHRRAALITIAVIIAYMFMVGVRPSAVRAVLMASAYLIATRWFSWPLFPASLLAFAAFLMTLIHPNTLFSIGFQLSFTATLGIIQSAPLEAWAKKQVGRFLSQEMLNGKIGNLISITVISFAAQLFTMPLIIHHFGTFPLIAILTNILVVPAQFAILVLGMIITAVGLISIPAATLIGWIAWLCLAYTVRVIQFCAAIPFANITGLQLPIWMVVSLYLSLGLGTWYLTLPQDKQGQVRQKWGELSPKYGIAMGGIALLFLALNWVISQPDGELHVHFFDVGQGDAALITTPSGRQIVVDSGFYPSVITQHLGRTMPFWDRSIDLLIATHPDADHTGGLPHIMNRYDVEMFVASTDERDISTYYDEVLDVAMAREIPIYRATAGEQIAVDDGVHFDVIHPGRDWNTTKQNDNSLSFRLVYGEFSLLLTGDAEADAEQAMLDSDQPLRSVAMKIGHHGSRTSSIPDFVEAVQPQIALVSAGIDNHFDHPHPDVLCRYHEQNVFVLDTRCHGTIEVVTDGTMMSWWSHQPNVSDKSLACNQPINLDEYCAPERDYANDMFK